MKILTVLMIGAGLLVMQPAHAEIKTITTQDTVDAAGFGFTLVEIQGGSRCFGEKGQNIGWGLWARSSSEGLNAYAISKCRHTGFGNKNLQNGWKVRSVSNTRLCEYNDFGTWKTSSACTFTISNTPVVGSTSAFFKADVSVTTPQFGQDRRATLQWNIEIEGPTGTSPWFPQKPGAPALSSPPNDRAAAGYATFSWTAPATGAVDYRLCISQETYTGACEQRVRVTGTQAQNIPVPFRGERVKWYVQACNSVGCTNSTQTYLLRNRLPAATLVSPAEGAMATDRRPTFQWQLVPGAQTYNLYVWHGPPLQDFRMDSLSSNVASFRPATDLAMANPISWYVNACTTAAGCGSPENAQQQRSLNLPPPITFAANLAATFRHARCVNCHAVAATNFARGTGGLPSNHTAVTAATDCALSCHTTALLPAQGSVNPGWHAAPSTMDFRNKTDPDLCNMAKNAGSVAGTVLNHLTQDKLVLWAVGDGRVPGKTLTTAPPNSISAWQERIQKWVDFGMPCT